MTLLPRSLPQPISKVILNNLTLHRRNLGSNACSGNIATLSLRLFSCSLSTPTHTWTRNLRPVSFRRHCPSAGS